MRSTVKSKVNYAFKATNDHLRLVQQNLAVEKLKGKQLSEDLHLVDEEYCQLEEKYQDGQAQVQEFLDSMYPTPWKATNSQTKSGHFITAF